MQPGDYLREGRPLGLNLRAGEGGAVDGVLGPERVAEVDLVANVHHLDPLRSHLEAQLDEEAAGVALVGGAAQRGGGRLAAGQVRHGCRVAVDVHAVARLALSVQHGLVGLGDLQRGRKSVVTLRSPLDLFLLVIVCTTRHAATKNYNFKKWEKNEEKKFKK